MSAIGGIYFFNGAPINEALLIELAQRLNVRGPDGGHEVLFKSIGMAYRAFHTNCESHFENQPLLSPNKHLLTWDGRLDNRDDLMRQLRDDLHDDRTDVALVMAAYLKWGINFLPRIIGDFSLALWDPHTRSLILARDPVGPRTLYYHANAERIIWTTELAPLLDLAGINLEINENYIAEFLTRLPDPSLTPYKDIHPVPPGTTVTVQNGHLQVRRFWRLNPSNKIRYKTDAEYEDQFRDLFREAVACRLRVQGPVWAELSGGMDSSSIVCMADQLIKSNQAQTSSLETVSLVFDEALKSDERKYIQCVEERVGRKGLHLREDDFRMLSASGDQYSSIIPNPTAVSAEYYKALYKHMLDRNARVLLSGKGGDELLTAFRNPAPELGDLFLQGRFLELHHRIRIWSHSLKRPYFELLWQKGIVPTLPRKLRVVCDHRPGFKLLDLYDKEFVKRMSLHDRMLGPSDIFGFRLPSGRIQAEWFLRLVRELSAGLWRQMGNVEISYPFMHLPLIEFMQAIPFEQRVRPGQTRSLLRRALRNLLPEGIANRKGKILNTDAVIRAFSREWPRLRELLSDTRAGAHGYVNRSAVLAALDRARDGTDLSSLSVTYTIALELWLRSLEVRGWLDGMGRTFPTSNRQRNEKAQFNGIQAVS